MLHDHDEERRVRSDVLMCPWCGWKFPWAKSRYGDGLKKCAVPDHDEEGASGPCEGSGMSGVPHSDAADGRPLLRDKRRQILKE